MERQPRNSRRARRNACACSAARGRAHVTAPHPWRWMMERLLTKVAIVAAALAMLWPAMASAADSKDVRVVNTAEEAVPVAVRGTPTVKVVSQPFQKHVGNWERFDTVELTTVPAGKVLVIEYINAFESTGGAF